MKRVVLSFLTIVTAASCTENRTLVGPEKQPIADASSSVAPADTDLVTTPTGRLPRSCVHEVPNGSFVDRTGRVTRPDGSTFQIHRCSGHSHTSFRSGVGAASVNSPLDTGWIEYADYYTGANFSRLTASWAVPAAPSVYVDGATYFSFPGLQSAQYIIQPVIAYGKAGDTNKGTNYGGAFWSGASWHCNSGSDCVHSTPVRIAAGDAVNGTVASSNCSGGFCNWTITLQDATSGVSTSYALSDTQAYQDAVGGAVEIRGGFNNCYQYPVNGVFYSNLKLYNAYGQQVTPNWSPTVQANVSPTCGFRVDTSSSKVSLYHTPSAPSVNSVSANPTPAVEYNPFALTINGSNFDPSRVQVQLVGSGTVTPTCSYATPCPLTIFTTKTSTQLVLSNEVLNTYGTFTVQVRNGDGGYWASSGSQITVRSLY